MRAPSLLAVLALLALPSEPGTVLFNMLLRGVRIALDFDAVGACAAFDVNGSGAVEIDQLVAGVGRALTGCPAS